MSSSSSSLFSSDSDDNDVNEENSQQQQQQEHQKESEINNNNNLLVTTTKNSSSSSPSSSPKINEPKIPLEAQEHWKQILESVEAAKISLFKSNDTTLHKWSESHLSKIHDSLTSLRPLASREVRGLFFNLNNIISFAMNSPVLKNFFRVNELVLFCVEVFTSMRLGFFLESYSVSSSSSSIDFANATLQLCSAFEDALFLLQDISPLFFSNHNNDDNDDSSVVVPPPPAPSKTWEEHSLVMCEIRKSDFSDVKRKIATRAHETRTAMSIDEHFEKFFLLSSSSSSSSESKKNNKQTSSSSSQVSSSSTTKKHSTSSKEEKEKQEQELKKRELKRLRSLMGARYREEFVEFSGDSDKGIEISANFVNLKIQHNINAKNKNNSNNINSETSNKNDNNTTTSSAAASSSAYQNEGEIVTATNLFSSMDASAAISVITGSAGIGKTTILQILCLQQQFEQALLLFLPLRDLQGKQLRSVSQLLDFCLNNGVLRHSDKKIILEKQIPVVFCCDGYDEIANIDDTELNFFMKNFLDPIQRERNSRDAEQFGDLVRPCDFVIITSREERAQNRYCSLNHGRVDSFYILRWSDSDVKEFCVKFFTNKYLTAIFEKVYHTTAPLSISSSTSTSSSSNENISDNYFSQHHQYSTTTCSSSVVSAAASASSSISSAAVSSLPTQSSSVVSTTLAAINEENLFELLRAAGLDENENQENNNDNNNNKKKIPENAFEQKQEIEKRIFAAVLSCSTEVVATLRQHLFENFSGLPLFVVMLCEIRLGRRSLQSLTPSSTFGVVAELYWRRSEKRISDRLIRVASTYKLTPQQQIVTEEMRRDCLKQAARAGYYQLVSQKTRDVTAIHFQLDYGEPVPLPFVLLREAGLFRFPEKNVCRPNHRSWLEFFCAMHAVENPHLLLLNNNNENLPSSSSAINNINNTPTSPFSSSSPTAAEIEVTSSPTKTNSNKNITSPTTKKSTKTSENNNSSSLDDDTLSQTILWNSKFSNTWLLLSDLVMNRHNSNNNLSSSSSPTTLQLDQLTTHLANIFFNTYSKISDEEKNSMSIDTAAEIVSITTLLRVIMIVGASPLLDKIKAKHGLFGFHFKTPRHFLWLAEHSGVVGSLQALEWVEKNYKSDVTSDLLKKALSRSLDRQELPMVAMFVSALTSSPRNIPISLEFAVKTGSVAGTTIAASSSLEHNNKNSFSPHVWAQHLGYCFKHEKYDCAATLLMFTERWNSLFSSPSASSSTAKTTTNNNNNEENENEKGIKYMKQLICSALPATIKLWDLKNKCFKQENRDMIANRFGVSCLKNKNNNNVSSSNSKKKLENSKSKKKNNKQEQQQEEEEEEEEEITLTFKTPKEFWNLASLIRCEKLIRKVEFVDGREKIQNENKQQEQDQEEIENNKNDEENENENNNDNNVDDKKQEEEESLTSSTKRRNHHGKMKLVATLNGGGPLKKLSLHDPIVDTTLSPFLQQEQWLIDILQKSKHSLEHFDIAGSKTITDAISTVVKECNQIRHFNVSRTSGKISDATVACLKHCKRLEFVNVLRTGSKVSPLALQMLKKASPDVKIFSNL